MLCYAFIIFMSSMLAKPLLLSQTKEHEHSSAQARLLDFVTSLGAQ